VQTWEPAQQQPDIILCGPRRQLNLMNFSNWLRILFILFRFYPRGWIIFRFADHLAESRNPVRETIRSRVVLRFILLFCAVCVCYKTSGAYANQCPAICIFI
jgi:hypothetical protein